MAAVSVSFQARDDLNAIVDYYAKVGATGFSGVIEAAILERLKSLIQYPRMGRIVPEIGDESIRELLYRISEFEAHLYVTVSRNICRHRTLMTK